MATCITLMQLHQKNQYDAQSDGRQKPPEICCPTLRQGIAEEDWEAFARRWSMLQKGTRLAEGQVTAQLLACCEPEFEPPPPPPTGQPSHGGPGGPKTPVDRSAWPAQNRRGNETVQPRPLREASGGLRADYRCSRRHHHRDSITDLIVTINNRAGPRTPTGGTVPHAPPSTQAGNPRCVATWQCPPPVSADGSGGPGDWRRARNRRYHHNRSQRSPLHLVCWNTNGLQSKLGALERWLLCNRTAVMTVQKGQFSRYQQRESSPPRDHKTGTWEDYWGNVHRP